MLKKYIVILNIILFIILFFKTNSYANRIDDLFYKAGYMKKQKYILSFSYIYQNNNNFIIDNVIQNNIYHTGYDLQINSNNINKNYHGFNTQLSAQLIPPIKAFISYTYKKIETEINYTIPSNSFMYLLNDYNNSTIINDEEHTFMGGIELLYEYKYKNIVPYINLISAVGMTASTNYENIFYSLNLTFQAGIHYIVNDNIKLQGYTGINYNSYYNGHNINDKVTISIPENYLLAGIPQQEIQAEFIYKEIYENNINMIFGAELELYKHYNIFFKTTFINNLLINVGVEFKW